MTPSLTRIQCGIGAVPCERPGVMQRPHKWCALAQRGQQRVGEVAAVEVVKLDDICVPNVRMREERILPRCEEVLEPRLPLNLESCPIDRLLQQRRPLGKVIDAR